MTTFLLVIGLVLVVFWAGGLWLRRAEDLTAYDGSIEPVGCESFASPNGPSTGHRGAVGSIEAVAPQVRGLNRKERLKFIRDFMESMPAGREFTSEFIPLQVNGVRCEWVIAPGADVSRRVLYIHGGAFIAGSPNSHRAITSRFSEAAGAAVLAIDYRLMPEHGRLDGIKDCRTVYQWLLENGPEGPAPVQKLFMGGDSAGGNLSLMMAAWIRDQGLRAPDAVVALSPVADANYTGASIETNMASDTMLGPLFGALVKIPKPLLAWLYLIENRMSPSNPVVSPIYGDLAGLPPMLVQVSESEMLYDDARRYVKKARAAGSPVQLQSWPELLHVWQMFYPEVPEAVAAWKQIDEFLASVEA